MDSSNIADGALGTSISDIQWVALLLFTVETFQVVLHASILFRLRLIPKRDLVRLRSLALGEPLIVACSALYTGQVLWLAALHNIQHVFLFVTWNTHWYSIRVINYSSLHWVVKHVDSSDTKGPLVKSDNPHRVDVTLGTAFDLTVHVVYVCLLLQYLAPLELTMTLVIVACLTRLFLYNEWLPLADPNNVPEWVGERVSSIEASNN